MHINKYIAQHTALSRRQADDAVAAGRVTINRSRAMAGNTVEDGDLVTLDNAPISPEHNKKETILLNKPVGYVCSRNGQGSPTVYDLLPKKYENFNIAGRLDKDSSGLVVLTNNGDLLYELTHPSKQKEKVYHVSVNRELAEEELQQLITGVDIGEQRPSIFASIEKIGEASYKVTLEEGRNRQIRRSFDGIGTEVVKLKRIKLGNFAIDNLRPKEFCQSSNTL